MLDAIASERRLGDRGALARGAGGEAPTRPKALLDAVVAWVVRESSAFRPVTPERPPRLRARAARLGLLASALAPFLAIALG